MGSRRPRVRRAPGYTRAMETSTTGAVPRPEHPRPQFRRSAWINLNGPWTWRTEPVRPAQVDAEKHRDMAAIGGFEAAITVPFCPESPLSGVGNTEFIGAIWYHRSIEVPAEWAGRKVLLHFGAVFYRAEIYVDGAYAGQHVGGSVSFALDVTRFVRAGGTHDLMVAVTNDLWSGAQPIGKQSRTYGSHGCHYTRTTGIWQTVWMEAVDRRGLAEVQIVADIEAGRLLIAPSFHGIGPGQRFEVVASLRGREVGRAARPAHDGIPLSLDIADPRLWGAGVTGPLRPGTARHERGRSRARPRVQLRRAAGDPHRREAGVPQRQAPLPAAGARPGLLPRRHLDRSHG